MKYFLSIILLVAILIISGCLSEDKNTVFTPPTTTLNLIPTSETKSNAENKFDITSPGHYSLDSDITHSIPYGIKIRASSVIIEGNGHTISPSTKMTSSNGVWIAEKDMNGNIITNVQIKNLKIKNEETGIFMSGLKNSIINSVIVSENGKAVQLIRTENITIQNSEFMNNKQGIMIDNSQSTTVTKNVVHDNQISGIHLYSDSKNNVVTENTFSNNNYGISMGDVHFTMVSGNSVNNNRMIGIHVHAGSSSNTINKNKLVNNDIFIEKDCVNNTDDNNLKFIQKTVIITPSVIKTSNPVSGMDKTTDSDNDKLSDWEEINVYHTNPSNPDTDGDYIIDGKEIQLGRKSVV